MKKGTKNAHEKAKLQEMCSKIKAVEEEKMKKNMMAILLAMVLLMSVALTGCGDAKSDEKGDADTSSGKKIGCILGVGGLGDQAFNDLIYAGLEKAKKELKVDFDYAEPTQVSEFELMMRDMATSGNYAAIICVGFDQTDALSKVAPEFPDQQFAFIDGSLEAENVVNYAAKEEEGSFLAGVIAGLMKKNPEEYHVKDNNTIGFIAALETPILLKWNAGYQAGAQYINPAIKCQSDFIAGDNPFGDTSTAKEIAISQYNQGADLIYHAAGGAGLGVFDAAKEYNFYAIGCNSNQNSINPDHIAASILKRVDTAAYSIAKSAAIDHNLAVGTTITLGLKDEGMDYTLEGSNVKISEEDKKVLDAVKQQIVDGKIIVPTTVEEAAEFVKANQYQAD